MYKESILTRFSLLGIEIDKKFDPNCWKNEKMSANYLINPPNYQVPETIKKIVFGSKEIDDIASEELN